MYSDIDTIKRMIEDENVEEAKIRMLNGIQMNNSMEYFGDLMDYLENANINIFSKDDGSEITLDRSQWTSNYFAKIRAKLKFNFSKEKLKHYNDIAIYISNEENKAKSESRYEEKDISKNLNGNSKTKSNNNYSMKDSSKKIAINDENKKKILGAFKVVCVIIACICTIAFLIKLLGNFMSFFEKPIEQ